MTRQAKKGIKNREEASPRNYETVIFYEILRELKKGDKISKEMLDRNLKFLGICIVNLVAAFDMEIMVIGVVALVVMEK